MEYKVETSLYNFPAWQGGKDTLGTLIERDDCQAVEDLIETVFFDQDATDEDINDFLWFERDAIAEHLGYSDWDAYENGEENDEEDGEEDEILDTNGTSKIVRHHPLAIGELVWDDDRCEWATISMLGDESVGNHFAVLKNDKGEIWQTAYENVYQIAEGLRTANSGDIVCYEHNETEDEYPYYCPALQENFFSFEVVSELE